MSSRPEITPGPLTGERLQTVLAETQNSIDDIADETAVDEVSLDILNHDPEASDLMAVIDSAKSDDEKERAIRKRRGIFERVKREVALIAGVDTESVEHEEQNEVYRHNAADLLESVPSDATNEDVMLTLGMIRPSPQREGEFVFAFPSKLFPPYIKQAWDTYSKLVGEQDLLSRHREAGVLDHDTLAAVNLTRTNAHNNLARMFEEFLQLSNWDQEKYRKLVAKMRDSKFAAPMGELRETSIAVVHSIKEHVTATNDAIGRHHKRSA